MELCKLDILKATTSSRYGPHREFFHLWNELIAMANSSAPQMVRSNATHILSVIRNLYVPIHQRFSPTRGDQDSASLPHDHNPTHPPAAIGWTSAKKSIWSPQTPSSQPSLLIQTTRDQFSSRSVSPHHPAAIGWTGTKKNIWSPEQTPSPQPISPIQTTRDQSFIPSVSPHHPAAITWTSADETIRLPEQISSPQLTPHTQMTLYQSSQPPASSISPHDPSTVA